MAEEQLAKEAELEALFFLVGEPISLKKIAHLLQISFEEAKNLVERFAATLENFDRGLTLLRIDDKVQLVTKRQFQSLVQKLIQEDFRQILTPAALEVLTILAYLGPLPRSAVEYLRGVNSSYILRHLLIRGLIERKSSTKRNSVYFYQISLEFLKHLGLNKIEDLPEYEKYRGLLKRFEIENSEIKN